MPSAPDVLARIVGEASQPRTLDGPHTVVLAISRATWREAVGVVREAEVVTARLRAIAEVAGYFVWLHALEPTGRRLTGRHPRAAYWREYGRRRYRTDPAYRARKLAASARSLARRRAKVTA